MPELRFADLKPGDRIKLGEAFGLVTEKTENQVVIMSDGGREFSFYPAEFEAIQGLEIVSTQTPAKSKFKR